MGTENKPSFTKILLSLILCLMFLSCSQQAPEAKYVTASVIFDYSALNTFPTARLSIFVESNSDVRRYEEIKVDSISNGYSWDISEIIKIKSTDKMYAGNTNLIVPDGETIPTGEYRIEFINADSEKVETRLTLDYDNIFYTTIGENIPELMRARFGKRNIAIYDKEDKLLYYGERTEAINDSRKIWNKYRNAAYFYEVWTLSNNTVMCIMPLENVVPSQN